jgi:rhodanese-related sulfurtransferase
MLSNMFSRAAARSDPRTIGDEEFSRAVDEGSRLVIDVREQHEFAAGHVPGAVNMPLSTFDPAELPAGKPVVLICGSGKRSLNALRQAEAAGRDDVSHYAGGVAGWRSRGGPVTL